MKIRVGRSISEEERFPLLEKFFFFWNIEEEERERGGKEIIFPPPAFFISFHFPAPVLIR